MSSAAEPWEYPEHKQFERWDLDFNVIWWNSWQCWTIVSLHWTKLTPTTVKVTKHPQTYITITPCLTWSIAIYAARNQKIRDDWVKAMEARIIKEKLDECYRTEGVNHCKFFFLKCVLSKQSMTHYATTDKSCRDLADMYLATIKTHRVEGFRKNA